MLLEPYSAIFPEKNEPVMALQLDRKTGKIPKGAYGFIEFYCTDKGCDCRRTTLFVLNEKGKEKAVINMGFDPDDDLAGLHLDEFHKQSPYAGELLEIFVELINECPEFLEAMHRHYREVRTKVEGKKYRGKAFPEPGTFELYVNDPPELPSGFMEIMKAMGAADVFTSPKANKTKDRTGSANTIRTLADRYYATYSKPDIAIHPFLQDELRGYILGHDTFALEICSLLVELCAGEVDEDRIDASLRLLSDMLDILRVELERGRPAAKEHMERLQSTLAQKIYVVCGDANLCAAVSHLLLSSRVELLPVLHHANDQRLLLDAHHNGLRDTPPDEVMAGVFRGIEEMGASPFEALENMLQILALGNPEMQTALCEKMLQAESTLVRDTAALMLLHPMPDVRLGVSQLLAANSSNVTPETLRRMIITRNWFPEEIRKNIDQAVSNARRARIECAPLPKNPLATIYVSPLDGAFAQSFMAVVSEGKSHRCCSALLKRGTGVADSFIIELPSKKELKNFLDMMKQEGAFIETSMEYFDQRICHGLAEGAALGKAPNYWLANVAEVLGKDQWKAVPFDARRELEQMRAELENSTPELLADKSRRNALKDSADWCSKYRFADSWFEDDAEVDKVISAVFKKKHNREDAEWSSISAIIDKILEKRRQVWLERLTINTMWLKSSKRPPLQWHQLFLLAEAVGDSKLALEEIPLMESIAFHSLGAYLGRRDDRG